MDAHVLQHIFACCFLPNTQCLVQSWFDLLGYVDKQFDKWIFSYVLCVTTLRLYKWIKSERICIKLIKSVFYTPLQLCYYYTIKRTTWAKFIQSVPCILTKFVVMMIWLARNETWECIRNYARTVLRCIWYFKKYMFWIFIRIASQRHF